MSDIVIASAARTPVGSFNGAFANTPAHELGAVAIEAALKSAHVEPKEVDEVILGQVLTAGSKHSTRSKCGSVWRTSQPTLISEGSIASRMPPPLPLRPSTTPRSVSLCTTLTR